MMDTTPWTLTARWVFPVARPPLEHGVLTIAGERIVAVEEFSKTKADVDLGDVAILPGLVNAHTHLDLTGARGQCPPTSDFTSWLWQVIDFRLARRPEQVQADIAAGIQEAIATGTTLLGDIAAGGHSLLILEPALCRATVFFELIGLTAERVNQQDREALVWWWKYRGSPCGMGFSPHAPYSVHKSLFEPSYNGCLKAIHLAETRDELELIDHRQGPFVSFLQDLGVWNPDGLVGSLGEIITANADQRVSWIHGNYLMGTEPLPSDHTIVYCPRTHAAFGHPPHPFRKFLERGVRVALGTDSLASNPDLDILEEARFVRRLHPDLPGANLLRMITLAGAEALGWADQTGSLAAGKYADLVVLPFADEKTSDTYQLIFDSDKKVARVMIDGAWIKK